MNSSNMFFLDDFKENFKRFQHGGTPIVLYGIGEKTKLLIEKINGFNIVGLMDEDSAGEKIYGQNVLPYNEVIKKAKTIIIVSNMSVAEIIYQRIAFLKKLHGIDILFINGTVPCETSQEIFDNPYWNITVDDLRHAIDDNEIISFDLFDTLIMRNLLLPTDVFDLVERELAEKTGFMIDFKNKRIEAEYYTFRNVDNYCSIHDIYRTLRKMLGINEEQATMIKNLEIKTEYACCLPRASMVECYRYAMDQGKDIVITTDTFLTREYIKAMLDKCGIVGPVNLLISCEKRRLKYKGELFQHLKDLYKGRTILHVGDNLHSDGKMAEKAGLNIFKIKSAHDILETSTFSSLLSPAKNINDRKLLGLLAGRFFNNPFALSKHKGRLSIDSLFDIGYLSFGPLVLNFILWLIKKSKETNITRLLFFARDGYVLVNLYRKIVNYLGIDSAEAVYFLTSRRAASVAAIKTEDDITFIISNMCKTRKIKFSQLLSTAFGILPDAEDPLSEMYRYEITNEELVDHITKRYKDRIIMNASLERENYIKYIDSLGLSHSDTLGCVNFVGRGITQRFMAKIMERELAGFYFGREIEMSDFFGSTDKCFALYEEYMSPHTSRSNLAMKFIYGEVIFSSPEEQLVNFERNGCPIFEQRPEKRNFEQIKNCHAGIERFVEDIMAFDNNILLGKFNNKLVDTLFGLFATKSCVCSEEVKQSFVFNDYYNPGASDLRLSLA